MSLSAVLLKLAARDGNAPPLPRPKRGVPAFIRTGCIYSILVLPPRMLPTSEALRSNKGIHLIKNAGAFTIFFDGIRSSPQAFAYGRIARVLT